MSLFSARSQINHWHHTEIDLVQRMASDGHSPEEIAKHLPGRSRNAVIGLCHRRGIALKPRMRGPNREKRESYA